MVSPIERCWLQGERPSDREFSSATLSWEDILFSPEELLEKHSPHSLRWGRFCERHFTKDIHNFTGKECFPGGLSRAHSVGREVQQGISHSADLCRNKYEHKQLPYQKQRWGVSVVTAESLWTLMTAPGAITEVQGLWSLSWDSQKLFGSRDGEAVQRPCSPVWWETGADGNALHSPAQQSHGFAQSGQARPPAHVVVCRGCLQSLLYT